MRRTRRALVGDGGGTGGLGGDAPRPGRVKRNNAACDAIGVTLKAFASIRSMPRPATNVACPSGQQLVQVALRRASDESWNDAVVAAVAVDSLEPAEPWCECIEATTGIAAEVWVACPADWLPVCDAAIVMPCRQSAMQAESTAGDPDSANAIARLVRRVGQDGTI